MLFNTLPRGRASHGVLTLLNMALIISGRLDALACLFLEEGVRDGVAIYISLALRSLDNLVTPFDALLRGHVGQIDSLAAGWLCDDSEGILLAFELGYVTNEGTFEGNDASRLRISIILVIRKLAIRDYLSLDLLSRTMKRLFQS